MRALQLLLMLPWVALAGCPTDIPDRPDVALLSCDEPCGLCDAGIVVCEESEEPFCQQPDGFTGNEVVGQLGCGYCGTGTVACGDAGPECLDSLAKEVADGHCPCGDSVCVPGFPGVQCEKAPVDCGACRGTACDPVDCEHDRTGEPCEGCGTTVCGGQQGLADHWACTPHPDIGEECGTCNNLNGTWTCDPERGVVCQGGANECGGCGVLTARIGTGCGCNGTWGCDGTDAVQCDGQMENGCGGCTGDVDDLLGDSCGTCGMGQYACAGTDAVYCQNADAGMNVCGGCRELFAELGEPCGECSRWICHFDGGLICPHLGLTVCGDCVDEELSPREPCGLCNQGRVRCVGENEYACDETGIAKPGDRCEGGYLQCVDSTLVCQPAPMGWVAVPAGGFCMGAPTDERCRNQDYGGLDTELLTPSLQTRPFLVSATEITRSEWLAYEPTALFGECACEGEGCGRCPAEGMTWFEALDYANWRSRQENRTQCYPAVVADWAVIPPTGEDAAAAIDQIINLPALLDCTGYRLPTEAEWEYAARAGTAGHSHSETPGDLQRCGESNQGEPTLDMVAWWRNTAFGRPRPVGGRAPTRGGSMTRSETWRSCAWRGNTRPRRTTCPSPIESGEPGTTTTSCCGEARRATQRSRSGSPPRAPRLSVEER